MRCTLAGAETVGTTPPEPPPDATAAAARPRLWVALLLFIAALALRLLLLFDLRDYPAHLIPIFDANSYDDAARRLLAGEGFHRQFFYQPFLYPLFLAAIYAVSGVSVLHATLVHAVLGALTCALTYVLGTRLLDRAVGLVGAVLVLVNGPLLFHEYELLAVALATLWTPVLLLLALYAGARPSLWSGLAFGVLAALAVLTRSEFLPPLVLVSGWLVYAAWRHPKGRPLPFAVALLLGFAIVVMPVVRINARVNGEVGFLPFGSGVNFYLGNHPDPTAIATQVGFRWEDLHVRAGGFGPTRAYAKDEYFWAQARAYAAADPLGFAARLGGKVLQFFSGREIPRGSNVYTARAWSPLLDVLAWKAGGFGFPFGVLMPLAVLGALCSARRLPAPFWLFCGGFGAAIVLVFVAGRYRLPLVPALAILAAAGLVAIVRWSRARAIRQLVLAGGLLAGLGVAAAVPGPFALEIPELNTHTGLYAGIARWYRRTGDLPRALESYRRELEGNPRCAPAYTESGRILNELGRYDEALRAFEFARALEPDTYQPHHNLGAALCALGRREEAVPHLRRAVDLQPLAVEAHLLLAVTLTELGDYTGAEAVARQGLAADPLQRPMRILRAFALEQLGRIPEAAAEFHTVLSLAPDDVDAQAGLLRLMRSHAAASAPATRPVEP